MSPSVRCCAAVRDGSAAREAALPIMARYWGQRDFGFALALSHVNRLAGTV